MVSPSRRLRLIFRTHSKAGKGRGEAGFLQDGDYVEDFHLEWIAEWTKLGTKLDGKKSICANVSLPEQHRDSGKAETYPQLGLFSELSPFQRTFGHGI